MRFFILWAILAFSLLFAVSTSEKIKDSRYSLQKAENEKKQASRKLEKIAYDIKKAEKDIAFLSDKIDLLKADEEKTERAYNVLKEELAVSEKALAQTGKEIETKHNAFLNLAAEQFSVIFAMQQFKTPTRQSIISYEIYQAYKEHNSKELKALKKEIVSLQDSQRKKRANRDRTKSSLDSLIKKREDFAQKKKAKEQYIKNLAEDEEKYQKQVNQIVDRQNSLRDTLAQLNILQKKEVEAARKAAEARKEAIRLEKERARKLRLAKEKEREAKVALQKAKTQEEKHAAILAAKEAEQSTKSVAVQSEQVRKVNTSYKVADTYAYRGGKTISPISGARVVKKFGTYMDPVYNIKIFNESVTLQAPATDAKVQNVLNGKVVYAGTSSMLGKVVVVAHNDKMHTVYAGLSKIAPNIQKGSKIKKGYVVGKVQSKLIFQATKNSKHIDPLRLIHI